MTGKRVEREKFADWDSWPFRFTVFCAAGAVGAACWALVEKVAG